MSRTKKGSKPKNCDYEYWSKRVGNKGGGRGLGRETKKMTLARERMSYKEEDRKLVNESVEEVFNEYDLTQDALMKSLFPNAVKITYVEGMFYKNYIEVDGEIGVYEDTLHFLLAYQYFTGANYKDLDDLCRKACEDGALHGDMEWFYP